jgi:hypothetical protein
MFREPNFQVQKLPPVDLDMGVPFGVQLAVPRSASSSVADRIPGILHGHPPHVANPAPLFREESVLPLGRQYDEEPFVADVLEVGLTRFLAPRACWFGYGDPVLRDQLLIHGLRIFPLGNPPGDVEPVTVTQVAAGDLLDEALNWCRFGSILHEPPWICKEGACSSAQAPLKAEVLQEAMKGTGIVDCGPGAILAHETANQRTPAATDCGALHSWIVPR